MSAETLQLCWLNVVYFTAEYCASEWLNSVHVSKIDVQSNNTIRLLSVFIESIESTQL
jgi:hypothetical protein